MTLAALSPVDLFFGAIPDAICKECGDIKPHTLQYFRRNGNSHPSHVCLDCHNRAERERLHSLAPRAKRATVYGRILTAPCYECGAQLQKGEAGLCRRCFKAAAPGGKCKNCKYILNCQERITLNAWMICEAVSENDLLRVAAGDQEILEILKGRYK